MTSKPLHPGADVARLCDRHNLSVTEAAARVGINRTGFSELVNGRRGVSPEMAVRLSKVFGDRTAEDWMMQQTRYELAQVSAHRLKLKRLRWLNAAAEPC